MSASAAVVITTYNNPRVLGICLKSFSNQTSSDFDLFIADDGSTPETKAKVESLRPQVGRPIQHFWQPDEGYHKARINNEVFRHLEGYRTVICVDHDTIASHRFVEDHLAAHARESRACFMGRRVELGSRISSEITEDNVLRFNRRPGLKLVWSGLTGDTRGWLRGYRIGSPVLRALLGRDDVPDLLGSNFSVSRELLLEVNGYDEDYEAYWGEDGDLFIRMRNAGARLVGSKALAIQFHLEHPRLEPKPEHQARYQEALGNRQYRRCRNGIIRESTPQAAR